MTTPITTRAGKGSRLTDVEMDTNLTNLQATADQALALAEAGGGAGGGTSLSSTDQLAEGSVNLYHTAARVRSSTLTGLDTSSTADVTGADNVLSGLGKLQAKFAAFAASVRAVVLTGLVTSDASDVAATDTQLTAFGKLQAKFLGIAATIRGTVLTGLSTATVATITATDTVLTAFGKLQAQVSAIPGASAPVSLSAATNLVAGTHANRQIIFSGANANLTIQSDAAGGTSADDEYIVFTDEGSSGVPTLVFPDATTLVGGKDVVIGAVRKGVDVWEQYIVPKSVFGASKRGLVPAAGATPSATKYLSETGVWSTPAGGGSGVKLDGEPSFVIIPRIGDTNSDAIGTTLQSLDSSTPGSVNNATTSIYTAQHRGKRTGAAAAVSRLAGIVGNWTSALLAPSATVAGVGGFKARVSGAVADAIASGQFGIGFAGPTPAWTAASEPSAMTNCIMLAADSTDAQLSVMVNDGAGACTKIALNGGTGFPNNTNAVDWYVFEVTFNANGATRSIDYTATNKSTGVSVSGNITTNLPAEGTRMEYLVCRGSANNATTPACEFGPVAAGHFF
jgi:hypothetical protein